MKFASTVAVFLYIVHFKAAEGGLFSSNRARSLSKTDDDGKGAIVSSELIEAISAFITSATCLYVGLRFAHFGQSITQQLLKTLGNGSSSAVQIPNELAQRLHPNCSLSSHELELANAIIFPSMIETEFRDIGGLQDVKRGLLDCVVSTSQESTALKFNISSKFIKPARGVLLFGPPGCGKTSLVRALCRRVNQPLLVVQPSTLLRKYVGETSQLVKAIFSLAMKISPCCIFIDEMDSLFRSRRESEQDFDRNLKTEFMQLWDALLSSSSPVVVIGATNRPQDIDAAIQRRFERSFLVGPPNQETRVTIFKVMLRDLPTELFDFETAATLTHGIASYFP